MSGGRVWLAMGAWFAAGVSLAAQSSVAAGKPVRLQTTSPAVLVDCAPETQVPCMSVGVTPVDANGKPAPVVLPAETQLARSITLHEGEATTTPFFASAGLGPDAGQHGNVTLLLVDISGSMRQPAPGSVSRFAAVKTAIGQFLSGMQEGVDRVAIVPFESHTVTPTIRSAVYATTRTDAMAQLNALPAPGPKNNTALYQAVFSGVESLRNEMTELGRGTDGASGATPHLVVMTDGKNEVLAGDDPGLLTGELGLEQAAAQVAASHMDVIGIGFGDRAAIDAAALQRLSKRFFYAADATELLRALHATETATSHEVRMTWLLDQNHRLALMGRDPEATPELRLPDGTTLAGDAVRVTGPATGAPSYSRKATGAEMEALVSARPAADAGWSQVLVCCLLAAGAGVLMVALWFWVPRLVWGERYGQAAPMRSKRWSSDRPAVTSASGMQIRSAAVPMGFDAGKTAGGVIQRSAAQTTQLQPRGEFSRTRVTLDP